MEPWFFLWHFFLLMLLCISVHLLWMEYWCHIWTGTQSCYFELLDKLPKQIFRAVGLSLAPSLEPLAHWVNVASLKLFYRYYFGKCSLNWLNWFYFLSLEGGLLVILIDCMIFLPPFLNATRMSMSTVQYDNNCKFFLKTFSGCFNLIVLYTFSCKSMSCSGCLALHEINLN